MCSRPIYASTLLSALLLWPYLAMIVIGQVDIKTVSLWTDDGLKIQPDCAQHCHGDNYYGTYGLCHFLGCIDPWYNQCFCNPDRASVATSWVYSCVTSRCKDTAVANSAVVLYTSYCSGAGYQFPGTNIAVQTSNPAPEETGSSGGTVTKTSLVIATATATSASVSNPASEWKSRSIRTALIAAFLLCLSLLLVGC
ncbi:hypothetical protein BKA65DRAFT_511264 [Rhexocercosporidium sp. MPI-PUGE-AT-0058]|nr:hypothetical protein BKA65DRAFT_511264 [Rhexocercosporidium sp. MPI-PUGE-AT-0058]